MNEIDHLTEMCKSDTLSDSDRASIECMRDSLLDNYIQEYHHHKITEVKQGNWHGYKTRINSKEYISAPTMEVLKDKLYAHYSGKTFQENATIDGIFEEALEWHCAENCNTEKTKLRLKQQYVKRIKGTVIAEMPLKDITAKDIKVFLKSFSDQITRKCLVNLKTILNFTLEYAVEELEIIPYNVALGVKTNSVKTIPEKNVGVDAFSEFEVRRLVSHLIASTNVYDEVIVFSAFVGLRPAELEALEWDNIHSNTLVLSKANTERGNLKTGGHAQTHKHLCSDALELLKRYRAERPESTLIFPNKDNKCVDGDVINKHLKKACKALNMPYRSIYKIRAYATTQIANTGDYEAMRKTGGWSNSYMQDHYINNTLTLKNRDSIDKALNLGIFSDFLKEKTP